MIAQYYVYCEICVDLRQQQQQQQSQDRPLGPFPAERWPMTVILWEIGTSRTVLCIYIEDLWRFKVWEIGTDSTALYTYIVKYVVN